MCVFRQCGHRKDPGNVLAGDFSPGILYEGVVFRHDGGLVWSGESAEFPFAMTISMGFDGFLMGFNGMSQDFTWISMGFIWIHQVLSSFECGFFMGI